MKLLCLHGYGTSAGILQQQMSGIINALGEHNEYVFLEGEADVPPSPLVGMFASTKHRSYWEGWAGEVVENAHDQINAAIEDNEDEPFDGILGFSQGGALVMSYLLHQRISEPNAPPPFKFAVIMSSNAMLSPDPDYNHSAIESFLTKFTPAEMTEFHQSLEKDQKVKQAREFATYETLGTREKELAAEILNTIQYMIKAHDDLKIDEGKQLLQDDAPWTDFPRIYHPVWTPQRVNIPTVHVAGRGDSEGLKHLAVLARQMCSDGDVFWVEYDGLHDVPRKPNDVARVVSAMEKAHYLGQRQAMVF